MIPTQEQAILHIISIHSQKSSYLIVDISLEII
jgi:hypothetical protein